MPIQISAIYTDVCRNILEDPGLTAINLMSISDFMNYFNDTAQDFVSRTGLIKRLINITADLGVGVYPEPATNTDIVEVAYNQTHLYRTSGWYLDNSDPSWASAVDTPERWREDELAPEQIQIEPAPAVQGYGVPVLPTTTGYGTIAATSSANDFDILAPTGGYGTISSCFGPYPGGNTVFAESMNAGFGTINYVISSTGNLQLVSSAQPISYYQTINDYVYLIPDSFTAYLKYGILERIWSQDGEYKSPDQAQFASQRYQEGVSLAAAIMSEGGGDA